MHQFCSLADDAGLPLWMAEARKPLEDEKDTISLTLRSSIDRVLPVRAPNGKAREKLTQLPRRICLLAGCINLFNSFRETETLHTCTLSVD
ncbi:hypothetical protein HO173_005865 [Letharia columbiana]|uniref:Uncharacterized protein n=1 Tax=Letharia columbiana TaxID=112416 RepID=A0A8H6FWX2_9LECA|nr:uncharacterized protein HO173_005865 [Letharia columbiana]KAF6236234.1 hypothetical protein HO173_005865 [Letharia columbiana]